MPIFKPCALLLLAGLIGCASEPSYIIDHDQSYDFSGIKTYRWYDDMVDTKTAQYRQYNGSDKRVRKAVEDEMRRHGITEASSGDGDVWLNYSPNKQQRTRISGQEQGAYGSAAVGTYGRAVSIGYSTGPSVKTYEDGTAILDIIDVRSQKLVWRGVAQGRLKNDRDLADRRKATIKVTRELLDAFPPE